MGRTVASGSLRLAACAIGLLAAVGCAATTGGGAAQTAHPGYDVLVAHDSRGELTIVPESGVAFRSGSLDTEQVSLEWTTEHDVDPGKMLVWNRDRSRLLASLDATSVDVRHRSGDPFQFSLVPRISPHAAKSAPLLATPEVAEDDTTESPEDLQDDVTYAPSDTSLGQWNRPPSLE